MSKIILNIGRYPGEGYSAGDWGLIDPDHIIHTWARLHLRPFWIRTVYPEGQEATIVVIGNTQSGHGYCLDPIWQSIYALSRNLRQDCIAVKHDGVHLAGGFLVGPYAKRWGQFNDAFFIGEDHVSIKSIQAHTRGLPLDGA